MLVIKGFNDKIETKKCFVCRESFPTHKLTKIKKSGKVQYICSFCINHLNDYSTRNNKNYTIGNTFTYGIEIEFQDPPDKEAAGELLLMGFLRCYDASISDAEYKSPVFSVRNRKFYLGLYHFYKKYYYQIKSKIQSSHIHISHSNGIKYNILDCWDQIKSSKYIEILIDAITEDRALFGRNFHSDYAHSYYDVQDRYFFIQTTTKETLEFRLFKITNHIQLKYALRFCREFCTILEEGYSEFLSEEDIEEIFVRLSKCYQRYNKAYKREYNQKIKPKFIV